MPIKKVQTLSIKIRNLKFYAKWQEFPLDSINNALCTKTVPLGAAQTISLTAARISQKSGKKRLFLMFLQKYCIANYYSTFEISVTCDNYNYF